MSISFEEAVATLTSMFPDWDEETLAALLTSNNYHVEQTIETVLSMCGDTTTTTNADPTPSNHNTANMFEERVSTGSAGSAGGGYNQYYDAQQGEAQRRASRGGSNNYPVPAPNVSKYRGAPQQLPDNFLRPPGYVPRVNISDEELALMMQNEMFQNEVRQALGDDFVRQARSGGGRNQVPAGAAGGARKTDPATDTGMMKALASMGSATKQNLMQLAQRFSRNQTSTSGTTRSSGGQMYRNGETGTAREFKPLVDSNDDDEDATEVISFDSRTNRSQHILQDNTSNASIQFKSSSYDDDQSANPMIQQQYNRTNNLTVKKKDV